jgi:hypothetical protein
MLIRESSVNARKKNWEFCLTYLKDVRTVPDSKALPWITIVAGILIPLLIAVAQGSRIPKEIVQPLHSAYHWVHFSASKVKCSSTQSGHKSINKKTHN